MLMSEVHVFEPFTAVSIVLLFRSSRLPFPCSLLLWLPCDTSWLFVTRLSHTHTTRMYTTLHRPSSRSRTAGYGAVSMESIGSTAFAGRRRTNEHLHPTAAIVEDLRVRLL